MREMTIKVFIKAKYNVEFFFSVFFVFACSYDFIYWQVARFASAMAAEGSKDCIFTLLRLISQIITGLIYYNFS